MIQPTPVLIDTDPGLDDALALVLALRSPAVDVCAITVVAGNVPLGVCTENVLRVLEALDTNPPPPVFPGCEKPLSPPVVRAEHVHGGDGIGGVSKDFPVRHLQARSTHAVTAIVDAARRFKRRLTVIALGPLTNVARALAQDSPAMRGIGRLVVMGGSVDGRGNATPSAEFNFFSDPSAARAVVRSGMPVVEVGLTVTKKAILPKARFDRQLALMTREPLRSFLSACAEPYFDFCLKHEGADGCALHDPLAVAAAIEPGLVSTDLLRCDVVTAQGLTRGRMVVEEGGRDRDGPRIQVATAVDTPRFIDLFLETVCGP